MSGRTAADGRTAAGKVFRSRRLGSLAAGGIAAVFVLGCGRTVDFGLVLKLRVRTLDANGQPVPGAQLYFVDTGLSGRTPRADQRFVGITDSSGTIARDFSYRSGFSYWIRRPQFANTFNLVAFKDGYIVQTADFRLEDLERIDAMYPVSFDFRLRAVDEKASGGRVGPGAP